jgi:hypothetical protein
MLGHWRTVAVMVVVVLFAMVPGSTAWADLFT